MAIFIADDLLALFAVCGCVFTDTPKGEYILVEQ
jgi:hypothetical protein